MPPPGSGADASQSGSGSKGGNQFRNRWKHGKFKDLILWSEWEWMCVWGGIWGVVLMRIPRYCCCAELLLPPSRWEREGQQRDPVENHQQKGCKLRGVVFRGCQEVGLHFVLWGRVGMLHPATWRLRGLVDDPKLVRSRDQETGHQECLFPFVRSSGRVGEGERPRRRVCSRSRLGYQVREIWARETNCHQTNERDGESKRKEGDDLTKCAKFGSQSVSV